MNDNILWAWRFVMFILLVYIANTLREIHRSSPPLPYKFDQTMEQISRDVSKLRDKIAP